MPGHAATQSPRGARRRGLERPQRAGLELPQQRDVPERGVRSLAGNEQNGAAGAIEIERGLQLDRAQPFDVVDHERIGILDALRQRPAIHRLARDARCRRAGLERQPQRRGSAILAQQDPQRASAAGGEVADVVQRQRIVGDGSDAA